MDQPRLNYFLRGDLKKKPKLNFFYLNTLNYKPITSHQSQPQLNNFIFINDFLLNNSKKKNNSFRIKMKKIVYKNKLINILNF